MRFGCLRSLYAAKVSLAELFVAEFGCVAFPRRFVQHRIGQTGTRGFKHAGWYAPVGSSYVTLHCCWSGQPSGLEVASPRAELVYWNGV
ncbi:MAG: hypothetical protein CMM01_21360 [Rhodopirellula sp.]|nr:hypothetical protein [Rhodopirellula sp.]